MARIAGEAYGGWPKYNSWVPWLCFQSATLHLNHASTFALVELCYLMRRD
jgi:hypothetical protein